MSLKNEKAAGTEQLQLLSFKYGGNKFENQMAEIVTKAWARRKAIKMEDRDYLYVV